MSNDAKKYFIPVNGSPIEVSEEVYRAYYQPIWNTRYHAQKNGECRCTKAQLWKCDGVCPGCPFHAAGKKVSIDTPIGGEDDELTLCDIVMKTGAHPFISKLKLFFKWGISFPENSYTIADKGARRVHYISRETLIKNITARYPQEKKPRVPTASPPSGGLTMTEPAEATFAQEVNHAAQQEKIAKPMRTG